MATGIDGGGVGIGEGSLSLIVAAYPNRATLACAAGGVDGGIAQMDVVS